MNNFKLNLSDFEPKHAKFKLSSFPDKEFTLMPFSLRVRAWAESQWSEEEIANIFLKQRIVELAKIAWFMLMEKDLFALTAEDKGLKNPEEKFIDSIRSLRDGYNVMGAIFEAVGTSEPEIKKFHDEVDKALGPKKQAKPTDPASTGEKSLTV
jgi:hypothetical protein